MAPGAWCCSTSGDPKGNDKCPGRLAGAPSCHGWGSGSIHPLDLTASPSVSSLTLSPYSATTSIQIFNQPGYFVSIT